MKKLFHRKKWFLICLFLTSGMFGCENWMPQQETPQTRLFQRYQDGLELFKKGKFEQARKLFLDLQSKHPKQLNLMYNLGSVYLRMADSQKGTQQKESLKKAEKYFKQILTKGSAAQLRQKANYNLGMLYAKKRQYETALYHFGVAKHLAAKTLKKPDGDAEKNRSMIARMLRERDRKSRELNRTRVFRYEPKTIRLSSAKDYKDPIREIALRAEFTHKTTRKKVVLWGYPISDHQWEIRFIPTLNGKWNYKIKTVVKSIPGSKKKTVKDARLKDSGIFKVLASARAGKLVVSAQNPIRLAWKKPKKKLKKKLKKKAKGKKQPKGKSKKEKKPNAPIVDDETLVRWQGLALDGLFDPKRLEEKDFDTHYELIKGIAPTALHVPIDLEKLITWSKAGVPSFQKKAFSVLIGRLGKLRTNPTDKWVFVYELKASPKLSKERLEVALTYLYNRFHHVDAVWSLRALPGKWLAHAHNTLRALDVYKQPIAFGNFQIFKAESARFAPKKPKAKKSKAKASKAPAKSKVPGKKGKKPQKRKPRFVSRYIIHTDRFLAMSSQSLQKRLTSPWVCDLPLKEELVPKNFLRTWWSAYVSGLSGTIRLPRPFNKSESQELRKWMQKLAEEEKVPLHPEEAKKKAKEKKGKKGKGKKSKDAKTKGKKAPQKAAPKKNLPAKSKKAAPGKGKKGKKGKSKAKKKPLTHAFIHFLLVRHHWNKFLDSIRYSGFMKPDMVQVRVPDYAAMRRPRRPLFPKKNNFLNKWKKLTPAQRKALRRFKLGPKFKKGMSGVKPRGKQPNKAPGSFNPPIKFQLPPGKKPATKGKVIQVKPVPTPKKRSAPVKPQKHPLPKYPVKEVNDFKKSARGKLRKGRWVAQAKPKKAFKLSIKPAARPTGKTSGKVKDTFTITSKAPKKPAGGLFLKPKSSKGKSIKLTGPKGIRLIPGKGKPSSKPAPNLKRLFRQRRPQIKWKLVQMRGFIGSNGLTTLFLSPTASGKKPPQIRWKNTRWDLEFVWYNARTGKFLKKKVLRQVTSLALTPPKKEAHVAKVMLQDHPLHAAYTFNVPKKVLAAKAGSPWVAPGWKVVVKPPKLPPSARRQIPVQLSEEPFQLPLLRGAKGYEVRFRPNRPGFWSFVLQKGKKKIKGVWGLPGRIKVVGDKASPGPLHPNPRNPRIVMNYGRPFFLLAQRADALLSPQWPEKEFEKTIEALKKLQPAKSMLVIRLPAIPWGRVSQKLTSAQLPALQLQKGGKAKPVRPKVKVTPPIWTDKAQKFFAQLDKRLKKITDSGFHIGLIITPGHWKKVNYLEQGIRFQYILDRFATAYPLTFFVDHTGKSDKEGIWVNQMVRRWYFTRFPPKIVTRRARPQRPGTPPGKPQKQAIPSAFPPMVGALLGKPGSTARLKGVSKHYGLMWIDIDNLTKDTQDYKLLQLQKPTILTWRPLLKEGFSFKKKKGKKIVLDKKKLQTWARFLWRAHFLGFSHSDKPLRNVLTPPEKKDAKPKDEQLMLGVMRGFFQNINWPQLRPIAPMMGKNPHSKLFSVGFKASQAFGAENIVPPGKKAQRHDIIIWVRHRVRKAFQLKRFKDLKKHRYVWLDPLTGKQPISPQLLPPKPPKGKATKMPLPFNPAVLYIFKRPPGKKNNKQNRKNRKKQKGVSKRQQVRNKLRRMKENRKDLLRKLLKKKKSRDLSGKRG